MVTGDHDQHPADWSWSERMKNAHSKEWAEDWQYGSLWRFVPRPSDTDVPPTFEPFGPDGLPGSGWEINVDRGESGTETRSPAQRDLLMQITFWRRPSPGMRPWSTTHKMSREYI